MKRLIGGFFILLLFIFSILIFRTINSHSKQPSVKPAKALSIDTTSAVTRFAQSLTYQTISFENKAKWNPAPFEQLATFLKESYPNVHQSLDKETVNNHSLLYKWTGKNKNLAPILLMAHTDVVNVDENNLKNWKYDPFSGTVADGYIWGRGTLDNKSGVIGILEAVEHLLSQDFEPNRTIYLAFGHDEEIGGYDGAQLISNLIERRNIQFEAVVDEGGFITKKILPVNDPAALIGIAEKGYVSFELSVNGEGGHSSAPPQKTNIGILSSAIHNLETSRLSGFLRSPTKELFSYISPNLPFIDRMIFSNLWLFSPLVENQLSSAPSTNALLRSTTATTMFNAGIKDNVLPTNARAVVNVRIFPGENIDTAMQEIEAIIDDPKVTIQPIKDGIVAEPSEVSSTDTPAYKHLQNSIRAVYPDVIVAPYLFTAATDSRHYTDVTPNIYRFLPVSLTNRDVERIHSTNERLAIDDYISSIHFYTEFIQNYASQ